MIDLPVALALDLRWREPENNGSRLRPARRILLAARRLSRELNRARADELAARPERPLSQTI